MTTQREIVRLLSDGGFHSGTHVGQALGISRSAVCKAIKAIADSGLAVHRVPGRGYRLAAPVTLLDAAAIEQALDAFSAARLAVDILQDTDSTNAHLLRLSRTGTDIAGRLCAAEVQRAGRGRRGRTWIATPYSNVMLSIGWRFEHGPARLSGLSLAAGIAVAQALRTLGVDAQLKWPNDIFLQGKKLGGLLIEMQGEAAGPSLVVLGVGLNVCVGKQHADSIDQPWIDLAGALERLPDRNRIVAAVANAVVHAFTEFANRGFGAFRAHWQEFDAFIGRAVRLSLAEGALDGVVRGVDHDGGLVVECQGGTRVFHAGEVSVRSA